MGVFVMRAQVVGPTLAMLRARSAQQQVQLAQLRDIKACASIGTFSMSM